MDSRLRGNDKLRIVGLFGCASSVDSSWDETRVRLRGNDNLS
jgi:hypothetical protein